MCVCVCIHRYIYIYIYIYIYMFVYMYMCMFVRIDSTRNAPSISKIFIVLNAQKFIVVSKYVSKVRNIYKT